MSFQVTIYTDGSCAPTNPGPGGIGIVMSSGDRVKEISGHYPALTEVEEDSVQYGFLIRGKKKKPIKKDGKYWIETTNNRMEILAIIHALEALKKPGETDVLVYTDSQWAMNMLNGSWKPKENLDMVYYGRELIKECKSVEFEWVKGHAGDEHNEKCNTLALTAARVGGDKTELWCKYV